jgi:hypothetical protein
MTKTEQALRLFSEGKTIAEIASITGNKAVNISSLISKSKKAGDTDFVRDSGTASLSFVERGEAERRAKLGRRLDELKAQRDRIVDEMQDIKDALGI